ncbi:phage tail sheath family protein [Leptospira interrogans]
MADIAFHHGTRVSDSADRPVQIRTAQSAVVFLSGTAPDADPTAFPLDTPVLISGSSNYSLASQLGDAGTLKTHLDAIFDQGSRHRLGAYVYINRVEQGLTTLQTLSNLVGDAAAMTGVHAAMKVESMFGRRLKPRLFIAPGFTGPLATDGVASVNVSVGGHGYVLPPLVTFTGGSGQGAEAIAQVVDGEVTAIIVRKPGFGYTGAPTVVISSIVPAVSVVPDEDNAGNGVLTLAGTPYGPGIKAGEYTLVCTSAAANAGTFSVTDPDGEELDDATVAVAYDDVVKFTIADGADDFEVGDTFTLVVALTNGGYGATATATVGTVGNPVAHELGGICEKLRAVGFIDGPNSTDQAAVIARGKYGSERLYIVDPFVQVWDTAIDAYVPQPASGRFAGVQVRVDREIGFYKSVSNEPIFGIDGVNRPISYGTQTNYLNENAVNTVVNFGEGYRTWGNRTTANTFLAVRRTRDFVNEAIEDAYLSFVDRPLNDANLKFLIESGRAFLRTLEAEGYVLRGSSDVWVNPDLNAPSELKQGRVTLSLKYEVPPPMEDIRVIAHENLQAYELLIDRVRGAIEVGPLALSSN